MAPKSKQAGRRSRAHGRSNSNPRGARALDSGYEMNLFDQLPVHERMDVANVARILVNTYDDMTVARAMPAAARLRREHRGLFDDILGDTQGADMETILETMRQGTLIRIVTRAGGDFANRRFLRVYDRTLRAVQDGYYEDYRFDAIYAIELASDGEQPTVPFSGLSRRLAEH